MLLETTCSGGHLAAESLEAVLLCDNKALVLLVVPAVLVRQSVEQCFLQRASLLPLLQGTRRYEHTFF